jgi:hypothetical protein
MLRREFGASPEDETERLVRAIVPADSVASASDGLLTAGPRQSGSRDRGSRSYSTHREDRV